jgi:large subunit ribosomal protein L30
MYAAVRLRGDPDTRKKARTTMERLGLEKTNHVLLLPETDAYEGMLNRAKDYITYGTVDTDYAAELLDEQGETQHGPLSESLEELGYDSVEDLVQAFEDGEAALSDLRDSGFRNVLRLNPPSKGYADTRRHYNQGGSLGDRGDSIVELLERMR